MTLGRARGLRTCPYRDAGLILIRRLSGDVDVDKLPDDDAASAALVGFDLNSRTLAKATLTGLYGR
jgi:hypothetical protein